MFTDEFLDMCYSEYCTKNADIPFHEYAEKRFKEHMTVNKKSLIK